MHIVDLQWVNIHVLTIVDDWPKFNNFFVQRGREHVW